MIKGIITGDLINSSKIAATYKDIVIDSLKQVAIDFSSFTAVKLELFRGDSFQVAVDDVQLSLTIAIALRTKLKASTPNGVEGWDARVSLGIGDVSYESDNIVTSDGEAFKLSGRAFDKIGKKRLTIATQNIEFNEAIDLNTRFADEIISALTIKQARVVYYSLLHPTNTQKEMSEGLDMSIQNFNGLWSSAKGKLILDYIEYFKSLVNKYISK